MTIGDIKVLLDADLICGEDLLGNEVKWPTAPTL